jgi:hypothetical protein
LGLRDDAAVHQEIAYAAARYLDKAQRRGIEGFLGRHTVRLVMSVTSHISLSQVAEPAFS